MATLAKKRAGYRIKYKMHTPNMIADGEANLTHGAAMLVYTTCADGKVPEWLIDLYRLARADSGEFAAIVSKIPEAVLEDLQ